MRGGYGYTEHIPAEAVAVTASRIRIRVRRVSGEMVERVVRPENLSTDRATARERE